ncbi:MAG: hypothetical protein WAZ18_04585 [Alphaproteobacteria bacterium]
MQRYSAHTPYEHMKREGIQKLVLTLQAAGATILSVDGGTSEVIFESDKGAIVNYPNDPGTVKELR